MGLPDTRQISQKKLQGSPATRRFLRISPQIKEEIRKSELIEKPAKSSATVVTNVEIILPLAGMIDLDKEVQRLQKEIEKTEKEIKRAQGKLNNEGFLKKAPTHNFELVYRRLISSF